jgi:hypothetical protein
MLILMFAAFTPARLAGIRTNNAYFRRLAASQAHQLRSSITDNSALHIQLDTARHHFNIFLLRTG